MNPALERFTGGRKAMLAGAVLALGGLALTGVAAAIDLKRALFGYLIAYTYWMGASLGALLLLMVFHATGARWVVILRRLVEAMAWTCVPMAFLFIPIALGMEHLFLWVNPPEGLPAHLAHLLHHKHPYLNVPFFLIRAVIYFVVWALVAFFLSRWSALQDEKGRPELSSRQKRFAVGMLPLMALTLTFAAFDWLMSLTPEWFSTIFAVYYFAGIFLSAVAILAIVLAVGDAPNLPSRILHKPHLHSVGKLLLAFVAFWAYIAFSQLLLIWIANIPEEVIWYRARMEGGWQPAFIFLVLVHFVVPFILLLSRDLKMQPRKLGAVAAWILVAHFVDLYWVVIPVISPEAPSFHLADLTAWVGLGGLWLMLFMFKLRGGFAVPVGDPHLEESLRYHPS